MQQLVSELDKTQHKVIDSRKEMLNRIEALIGELTTAKTNIAKQVFINSICVIQIDADETQMQMTVAAQLNQLPKKG